MHADRTLRLTVAGTDLSVLALDELVSEIHHAGCDPNDRVRITVTSPDRPGEIGEVALTVTSPHRRQTPPSAPSGDYRSASEAYAPTRTT